MTERLRFAWAAYDARRTHGEASPEYEAALDGLDNAIGLPLCPRCDEAGMYETSTGFRCRHCGTTVRRSAA